MDGMNFIDLRDNVIANVSHDARNPDWVKACCLAIWDLAKKDAKRDYDAQRKAAEGTPISGIDR